MRVFLTGATGFVGSHVAQSLHVAGAELRLLARKTSRTEHLNNLNAELVIGDLLQPDGLATALTGCDALVHAAADYRLWVRDPDAMYAANVQGTRTLLRLAREAGVHRVVYTSSVATMGFRSDGRIVDEDTPVSLDDMIGHYKRSKFLAEQEAIQAARNGQHVVILNPTTPIGANDAKPTPTGRIVVDFLNRKFPAYVDTGLNLVDVQSVAAMHVAALERGTSGERYILGGENLTLKQILDRMAAMTGLPRIERLLRDYAESRGEPVWTPPVGDKRSQYEMLGALVARLERLGVDSSWCRFLRVVFCDWIGLSLRNEALHGERDQINESEASLVLVALLFVSRGLLSADAGGSEPT